MLDPDGRLYEGDQANSKSVNTCPRLRLADPRSVA